MPTTPTNKRPVWLALLGILALALTFRLVWVLLIDPRPALAGGDGPYYLNTGSRLAGHGELNWSSMVAIGPIYPLYLSIFFRLWPTEEAVVRAARIGQAVMDVVTVLAVFDLGRRLFDARVGLLAAGLLAIDLRFVVTASAIATETIFIFFLVTSSWAFALARQSTDRFGPRAIGAGALGLLAAFTRAVALPIPVLLTGSLLLPQPSRAQVKIAAALLVIFAALVIGWSARQYLVTGQMVLISDGLGGNFWMGSRTDGQWHGATQFSKEITDLKKHYGRYAYIEDALHTIAADPLAYGKLLVLKTASAYLQPYGTASFPGDSLKDLAVQTIRGQLSIDELIKGDAFWPKLYIYLFHFTGLIGGLIGIWLTRRAWLELLPLTLPIVALSITYILLTIIPRYIFPTMPFYTVLAAYTLVAAFDAWRKRNLPAAAPAT